MTIYNHSEQGPGYTRLKSLFDNGTFAEIGAHIKRRCDESEYEGVVCGYGSIGGRLVFAFSQESSRLSGAVDEYHAKKIEALYSAAMRNGAPVIGIFDSNGAIIDEGIASVCAYGKIAKCVSLASGKIPQIAIIAGVCSGSMAAVAQMFDISIAVNEKARLYVGSPFHIGEEYGKAEKISQLGLVSMVVDSDESAYVAASKLVDLLPDNCEGLAKKEVEFDNSRISSISDNMYENINAITDDDSFIELFADNDESMIVGLATIGGVTVGIVANNPSIDSGMITAKGADKAKFLVSFADCYSIPVITLVDSYGVKTSKDEEEGRVAASLASLAMAYSSASTAKITLVCGCAYGAAVVFMGSKALGADIVLAVDGTSMGALSPKASVAFLENDLVGKESSRDELEEKWKNEKLSVKKAAEIGEVDDIIPSSEARARICSAVYMLSEANVKLSRKHIVLPL